MRCSNCKKKDTLTYLPWLGQIYECSNCGYRGVLIGEDEETSKTSKKNTKR